MERHKLLNRQVNKNLTEQHLNDPVIQIFLTAINDSYLSFERDKELLNHAFGISEKEYQKLFNNLNNEYELKKISIERLKKSVKEIDQKNEVNFTSEKDELLVIVDYLNTQIIKRKETEVDLSRTLELLTTLLSNLNSGILVEDENRKILYTNQLFCDTFSIPANPEQMKGIDCSNSAEQTKDLFKNPEIFVNRINEVLANKVAVFSDILELKDGRILERDYIPIYIDNLYKGHLWDYTDITERKKFENKLVDLTNIQNAILNGTDYSIIYTDTDGMIRSFNNGAEKMLGYNSEEIINIHNPAIFHEPKEVVSKAKELTKELGVEIKVGFEVFVSKAKNNQIETNEWTYIKKSGDTLTVLLSVSAIHNSFNEIIGYLGIARDITQQKKAQEEILLAKHKAEESSKAKESFLANMSHEIRTPMNGILGMSKLLSSADLSDKNRTFLNSIQTSANNLLVIINDILDLSKIESGKLTFEKIGFRLNDIIIESKEIVNYLATEKNLVISIEIDETLSSKILIGDPIRLNQILTNLLNNAVKFTTKGEVKLLCRIASIANNNYNIEFSIIDTGIGIHEDTLKTIFESFSQADASTTRKFGGTGLGLSICKKLVELQNGNISVESKLNAGTTFRFCIPFEKGTERDLPSSEETINTIDLSNIKLLLVEDHKINQAYASSILEIQNIKVDIAENGEEAIEVLKQKTYDIILMDIQMPIMGGIEATKIIREELKLETPIIALTANAFSGESDKYLKAGMNEFVSKPFKDFELTHKIANLLNRNSQKSAQKIENRSDDYSIPLNDEVLFSLKKLEDMSRGNKAFVEKLVNLFKEETPKSIQALNEYLENREYDKLKSVAHKMKPSIDMMDIKSIREDIQQIEDYAGQSVNLEQLPFLIKKVSDVCNKVVSLL